VKRKGDEKKLFSLEKNFFFARLNDGVVFSALSFAVDF